MRLINVSRRRTPSVTTSFDLVCHFLVRLEGLYSPKYSGIYNVSSRHGERASRLVSADDVMGACTSGHVLSWISLGLLRTVLTGSSSLSRSTRLE